MLKHAIFSVLVLQSLGSTQVERFQARSFQGKGGISLPYRIHIPSSYKAGTPIPIVLALHGSGERGDNNTAQLTSNRLATAWVADSVQAKHPSIIVAPQCPLSDSWVDYYKPVNSVAIRPSLGKVVELLDSLEKEFTLDLNRLYVVGLSMGGFASWELLARYPGRFAAAVPICGAGDTTKAALMKTTPIWAFHGSADNVVAVVGSRTMIAALKKVGTVPEPKYTEYAGVGHDSWTQAMRDPNLVPWLYAQAKAVTRISPKPKHRPLARGPAVDASMALLVTLDGRVVLAPSTRQPTFTVGRR